MHEGKTQNSHNELMIHLKEEIPSLSAVKSLIPIVVDDETAFYTIKFTWNILRLVLETHNKCKHGAASSEIPLCISHMQDVFHQSSEAAYENRLEELKIKYSEAI